MAGHGSAFRMGGDEFCVLAPLGAPAAIREELIAVARAALVERGEGFEVGASCGHALLPEDGADAAEALRVADRRLYAEKNSGRISARMQSTRVLRRALDEWDADLGSHGHEVGVMAAGVARRLGLDDDDDRPRRGRRRAARRRQDRPAADSILHKRGPLDEDEWTFMRRHTLIGERIVQAAPALVGVGQLIRSSHERWDGRGYPDGLAGDAIPLGSQIVFICDAFSAMTTDRSYRPGMPESAALAELRRARRDAVRARGGRRVRGRARRIAAPRELSARAAGLSAQVGASRERSARETCSNVTTPRRRPSASTAISAPRRRSGSEPSRLSSGVSAGTRPSAFGRDHVAHRDVRPFPAGGVLHGRAVGEPREAAVVLHHGEPAPALVAQEELLVGAGAAGRPAGMVTGSASMMSATVMPASRSVNAVWAIAALRALGEQEAERDEPDRVEGRAAAAEDEAGRCRRPISSHPKAMPMRAAKRVARLRSPVTRQAAARAMRPPSSGKAGTRLNTSRNRFMVTSRETTTSTGDAWALAERRAASQKESPPAIRSAAAVAATTMASVTSGPATATRNSAPGRVRVAVHAHHAAEQEEVDAGHVDALPARGQRVPQLVQQDRAEERERRHDGDDVDRRLAGVQGLPQGVPEQVDDQEQDQEPRVVHAHADPEQAQQRQRARAHLLKSRRCF